MSESRGEILKLINKTKWDTLQLKKLIVAIINNTGSHKNHQITVKTGKGSYSGWAYLNNSIIMMRVPKTFHIKWNAIYHPTETTIGSDGLTHPKIVKWDKTEKVPNKFNIESFAQVLEHEIGHNLGLRHPEMAKLNNIDVGYSKSFVVEPQLPKPVVKKDFVAIRKQKSHDKVLGLVSKIKRMNNLLKKWKKKESYYLKKSSLKA